MSGFITLHRKLLEWEWYSDINTKTLFIHCLLKANWEDKNWRGIDIKRGSFVTSNQALSKETNLTIQQIRTSIFKLTKTHELNIQTTNKYTLLTVVKYEDYQAQEKQSTNKQQTNNKQTNKQVTTTNNINNKQLNNNNILNNSLLSEIKISDDKKFFLFKNNSTEISEEKMLYFKTALYFQELFIKNLKDKNSPITQVENAKYKSFVEPIRLMIEKEKVTTKQLRDAYDYLNSPEGEFWKSNILSTSKLREKLPVLLAKKNTKSILSTKNESLVPDPNKRKQF